MRATGRNARSDEDEGEPEPAAAAASGGDRVTALTTSGLQTQCETTQVREEGMGATLFGYTRRYGNQPGGQAEYLRVPLANSTHIKVPEGPPDERFVYLSAATG